MGERVPTDQMVEAARAIVAAADTTGYDRGLSRELVNVQAVSSPLPARTLCARTTLYVVPAVFSYFAPSVGVAVVDNIFGRLAGGKALLLAQQKLHWMSLASKFAAPAGTALGIFVGTLAFRMLERLAKRWGATRVDGTAGAPVLSLPCPII